MNKTALIYCGDVTLDRLQMFMPLLADMYPVRIAINNPLLAPATHIIALDSITITNRFNVYRDILLRNNTVVHVRDNRVNLLHEDLLPLVQPFTPSPVITAKPPEMLTSNLTFITGFNVAAHAQCNAVVVIGSSLTSTPHCYGDPRIFQPDPTILAKKILRVNSMLPYLKKFFNIYQYTELNSNLAVPKITFMQLMKKEF